MSATSLLSSNAGTRAFAPAVPLAPIQRRLFWLFVLALAISFSPSKALGQLVPLIFLAGLVLWVRLQPASHILKLITFLLLYTLGGAFYYLFLPEFSFISYYVFLVTISSFLIFLVDFRKIVTTSLLMKLSAATTIFLIFEALYGLFQGMMGFLRFRTFDISTGDVVRGTIEPSLTPQGLGGNQIYAILISTLLLFILGVSGLRFNIRKILPYGLILLSWLMASVLHTMVYFVLATLIGLILFAALKKRRHLATNIPRSQRFAIAGILLFIIVLVPVVLPKNLRNLPYFLSSNLSLRPDAVSEKARATYYTLFSLPEQHPWQPIFGLGPGQYSSRASLIRSGEYLRGASLPLPTYVSSATEEYILSTYRSFLIANPSGASSFHPFFSWLSLFGEMGAIGLFFVVLGILWIILIMRKLSSQEFPRLPLCMLILFLYILLLGLHDNYWEFTQAVFPGMLAFKLSLDYLRRQRMISIGNRVS